MCSAIQHTDKYRLIYKNVHFEVLYVIVFIMEVTLILKIAKELGLEGTDLLSFIDRKENEALEREERKERER